MSERTRVFLDPDGGVVVLGVIVAAPTGVVYEHQCGGLACDQRALEGYYVPVGAGMDGKEQGELRAPFHRDQACVWSAGPVDELLDSLRAAVARVPFGSGDTRGHLMLDEALLDQVTEAWVPVVTPLGAGVLVWDNCD